MKISATQSVFNYINELELAATSAVHLKHEVKPLELLNKSTDEKSAAVDAGSTVSFVSGIPTQQKQDVLNSTLLAQLAANHAYDREKDTEQWYRKYSEVLQNIGWVTSAFGFEHYKSSSDSLQMSKVALDIIGSIASGNELDVLETTLQALNHLDPGSDAFEVFGQNGSSSDGGNFQLGTAAMDDNQDVSMCLGAFYFKANEHKTNFLFWSWSTKSVQMYTSAQNIVLNNQIYAKVRNAVIDKLGDKAQQFIKDIQI